MRSKYRTWRTLPAATFHTFAQNWLRLLLLLLQLLLQIGRDGSAACQGSLPPPPVILDSLSIPWAHRKIPLERGVSYVALTPGDTPS